MDSGLAIVAASPQLIVGVACANRHDVAVVHGGGVVGDSVSVDTFISSRGHKEGSMSLSRINGFLQAVQQICSTLLRTWRYNLVTARQQAAEVDNGLFSKD